MNPDAANSTGGLFFAALIAFTIWALLGAAGWKRKLTNLLIIVGYMAAGMTIGLLLGGATDAGGQISGSLVVSIGAVGGFGCTRRNKHQAKIDERMTTI